MKPLRVVMFVLALSLPAAPTRAAIIGLLGGDYDPQSIFDLGFNSLVLGCDPDGDGPDNTGLDSDFYCALYEILPLEDAPPYYSPFVVSSIDFRLLNPLGGYFSTDDIGGFLNAAPRFTEDEDPLNDLPYLAASELFPDGITFRLFDTFSVHCPPHCSAAFFSDDEDVAKVGVLAVNNVANVPEPATILLLVPAAAALMARRRWGKRGTSR